MSLLLQCTDSQIARDEKGQSKGYATLSFTDFVASDAAIESMNGQYLGGRPISLSYSFKKDGANKGERHGSTAERRLADLGKKNNVLVTGFLPPSGLAVLANMPPIPAGFSQAATAGPTQTGAPTQPPPGGYSAPPPGAPPGFANAAAPGQAPGFGPPPGMPPPPAGFNQFGR